MRHHNTRLTGVALLAVAALGLTACGGSSSHSAKHYAAVAAPQVALDVAHVKSSTPLTIGVVYTGGQDNQGAGATALAEGATVAAYRLHEAGVDVTIVAKNDDGTTQGSRAAVKALVSQNVAGIVDVSYGEHLDGALQAAKSAGVPVLLPYDDGQGLPDDPEGVWATGPTLADQVAAIAASPAVSGATKPVVVTLDATDVPSEVATLGGGGGAVVLSPDTDKTLPKRVSDADAVIAWETPAALPKLVAALQRGGITKPIVVPATALEPAFSAGLGELAKPASDSDGTEQATLNSPFLTVGEPVDDFSAGTAEQAFLLAVRALAQDPDAKSLDQGRAFADGPAQTADSRAYDAVVALADAAAKAGSSDPAKVAETLGALKLGASDGLVGPELDFTKTDALSSDGTVPLSASTMSSGARPAPQDPSTHPAPALSWFAATSGS